jgi:hypothetical protein
LFTRPRFKNHGVVETTGWDQSDLIEPGLNTSKSSEIAREDEPQDTVGKPETGKTLGL